MNIDVEIYCAKSWNKRQDNLDQARRYLKFYYQDLQVWNVGTDCFKVPGVTKSLISHNSISWLECEVDKFRCDDGYCINFLSTCDSIQDCPDGSDEGTVCCKKILFYYP